MNVLITAGGTSAPIDDVRQITNSSTGSFGAAIAEAAVARGAAVWYLHAPGALRPFDRPARIDLDASDLAAELDRLSRLYGQWHAVRNRCHLVPLVAGTVDEYADRLRSLVTGRSFDAAFLAMAASDYAPGPSRGKLSSAAEELIIRCRRLPKVIAGMRDLAPSTYLVGFKLLSGVAPAELIGQAAAAGVANRVDLTVANDLASIRSGRHTIHLVRAGHEVETFGPPEAIAPRLVDRVMTWAAERRRDA